MALDIAHYLQEHLTGEVTASPEVRRYFAHDGSILQLAPAVVVYPRSEDDVRKAARFSWQLAERGRIVPITARGAGTNTSGAAIGSGILLIFTAHMNKLLSLNTKKGDIVVEPGISHDKLEQTLHTHDLSLPPYPYTYHATLGGSLASNAMGEKSVKHGPISKFVQRLRVVLANGEVIETGPLSKRELNKKLGLTSLEGEIYRSVDALLEENAQLINEQKNKIKSAHNTAGYNIFDIKNKGEFNLTPLLLGSQGSLGIITEATLKVKPYQPSTKLILVSLDKLDDLNTVLPKILALKPSICDFINKTVVERVAKINPSQLKGVLDPTHAEIHLFVEFDDLKESAQKQNLKSLKKMIEKANGYLMVAQTPEDQQQIWKIRHSTNTILTAQDGPAKAVPAAEDVSVAVANLVPFLHKAEEIYKSLGLAPTFAGHAGSGVVRMYPVLDLAQVGDRQKMFKLIDSIYAAAVSFEGSISASAGDGRVRAPYLKEMYGQDLYNLMLRVKKIFDPFGTLNPGVKTATAQDVKDIMRTSYSHRYHENLPRI